MAVGGRLGQRLRLEDCCWDPTLTFTVVHGEQTTWREGAAREEPEKSVEGLQS